MNRPTKAGDNKRQSNRPDDITATQTTLDRFGSFAKAPQA